MGRYRVRGRHSRAVALEPRAARGARYHAPMKRIVPSLVVVALLGAAAFPVVDRVRARGTALGRAALALEGLVGLAARGGGGWPGGIGSVWRRAGWPAGRRWAGGARGAGRPARRGAGSSGSGATS